MTTIVSNAGPMSYFPDSVVCKHRMEIDGLPGLTRALRQLAADRPRREALGRSAWQYVGQNHRWSDVADAYEEVIERAAAERDRPRVEGARRRRSRRSSARRSGSRPHRERDGPAARLRGGLPAQRITTDRFPSPWSLGES